MRNIQLFKHLIVYAHETADWQEPDVHLWLPCGPETRVAVCAPNDLVDMYVSRNRLHLNRKKQRLYTLIQAKASKKSTKSAYHRTKKLRKILKRGI